MGVQATTASSPLRAFRQGVYRSLGRRKDSLFELLEAALAATGPANLVHLSLTSVFRRRWPSASDALAEGQVRPAQCRALIHRHLDEPEASRLPARDGPAPHHQLERDELQRVFQELAEELAPQQRAVFVLREMEEHSSEEVAAILGISPSTVRNHLFQARRILRRELRRRYPEYLPPGRQE